MDRLAGSRFTHGMTQNTHAPQFGELGEKEAVVVLGGTAKTGRRVVDRLRARAAPVRVGSRSGDARRALSREPRDLAGFARDAPARGVWDV
jgi:hypothetical protein